MTGPLLLMAAMLLVILIASELFTNALEHLADKLGISERVTGAMYVPTDAHWLRNALSLLLVLIYVAYVGITLRASERLVRQGHRTEAAEAMFFARLGLPTSWATILLQLGLGLVLLIAGAKGFIHGVEGAASQLGVSALLLSLIVIPIATELPEKVNS